MTDGSLAATVLSYPAATPAPTALIEACGLPEVGSRLADLSVRIDDELGCPFVLDGTTISVPPDVAGDLLSVAMVLREAIELDFVRRGPVSWPDRIVAHATAVRCGATVLRRRVRPGAVPLPGVAVPGGFELLAGDARVAAAGIAAFLQQRDGTGVCPSAALDAAARALPLACPTDVLLTSGGDDRQIVDWNTGLNSYGIDTRPTPWRAAFGSCTASAPTFRAFDAARRLRLRLLHAALDGRLDEAVASSTRDMRATLLASLGIDAEPGTEVVLTPSGTDAEIIALAVALAGGGPVHTIIVGPVEIGRGSSSAATGRHFSHTVPSGRAVTAGAPIDGVLSGDVTAAEVPIRDDDGFVLAPEVIAGYVDSALDAAPPGRVLLHVVEGAKTGIRAPLPECVDEWEDRLGGRLDVVVDAAQMRIDQPTVAAHLAAGRMIIVTGSKLFGGPPFSGAVLLPPSLADRVRTTPPPVTGLADYLAEADVPPGLAGLRSVARPGANVGLLARWAAALAEMRSFHSASWEIRDEVLRRLAAGLRGILDAADHVQIVESPYSVIPAEDQRGLRDLPTIFTFVVRGSGGALLDMDQAKVAQTLLGRDLTSELAAVPGAHQVKARSFHVGQPVKVWREQRDSSAPARSGRWIGALRLAIGAPTVSQVVFDHTRGATWTDRIALELSDVRDALDKLRLVVDHLPLG
jgi:hypothetical protein